MPSPESLSDFLRLYGRLFERSADGVIIGTQDGATLAANEAACRILGRPEAELVAVGRRGILVDDAGSREFVATRNRTGFAHAELRMRRPDGTEFPVEITSWLLPMAGGNEFVYGIFRDASELREAEEKLRASEQRYRALAEVSPNGILIHRSGVVEYANPAAARLAGAGSPEKMVGLSLLDFVHPDWRERERARTAEVLAGRSVETVEMPILVLDGSTRIVECALAAFADSAGPAVQVSLRDVTEERALQARLQVTSRLAAMGTLVSGVAHEINNPLTGLMTGLGTARADLRDLDAALAKGESPGRDTLVTLAAELKESLDTASESAERIARIVKDLAVFGGPNQQRVRVKLPEVAAAAIRWLPPAATALATVRVEDLGPPEVTASRGQIEQVIVNLVTNAAKATPAGRRGDVLVRLAPGSPGMARIEVIDHGTGIEPAVIGRIFDPFFTTRPSGERRGTGLGLAICHAIVDGHGGTISVRSDAGKGSTFTVELPAVPPPA